MIQRQQLLNYLNQELNVAAIKDYCPNGLQVEGSDTIRHVVTGVTASQRLIDAAIEKGADTLLVHHGYFWKGEEPTVTGMKRRRLGSLIQHNINLIAYHLPIDVHPVWGNNAQLGALMGCSDITAVNGITPEGVVMQGSVDTTFADLVITIEHALGKPCVATESAQQDVVTRVAWCTGGGQSFIEQAATAGAEVFITGEVSEQTIHIAREMNIGFIAAGHHATERYGVKAVGEHLANEFGLSVDFIDIDNPA